MTIQTSGHEHSMIDGWIIRSRTFDPDLPYAAIWQSSSGAEGTAATYTEARQQVADRPNGAVWFPNAGAAAEALDAGTREDYLHRIFG